MRDDRVHLSAALQERHPEIPWARISGFRIVLAHAYTHLNLELIWEAIAAGLPPLNALANEEIERFGGP